MMNERKIIIGKNAIVSGMMVMTAMLSAMITGCGCQKADEVSLCTPDSAATADSVPAVTYSEEEQAVLDENLSIDAAGNVVIHISTGCIEIQFITFSIDNGIFHFFILPDVCC